MTKIETMEMKQQLKEMIESAGNVVYTSIREVSKSGMSRWINFYIVPEKGQIRKINYYIEQLLSYKRDPKRDDALKIGGCGMDMGYHVVYQLSYELHGLSVENHKVKDGGYVIKQRWM